MTKLTEASSASRSKQIADLVRHCFDALNVFGLDAEAMKTRQKAFIEILKPYPIADVTKAFWRFLETGKTPPVPAEIKEICDEIKSQTASRIAPLTAPDTSRCTARQQIRDRETDEILEVNDYDTRLTPIQISLKYGNRAVYERFRV